MVDVRNSGPLDVDRALVVAFCGELDNRGYQVGHVLTAVPGFETTTVRLPVTLDRGDYEIHVVVDSFGHVPEAKRARGEWYAKAQLRIGIE